MKVLADTVHDGGGVVPRVTHDNRNNKQVNRAAIRPPPGTVQEQLLLQEPFTRQLPRFEHEDLHIGSMNLPLLSRLLESPTPALNRRGPYADRVRALLQPTDGQPAVAPSCSQGVCCYMLRQKDLRAGGLPANRNAALSPSPGERRVEDVASHSALQAGHNVEGNPGSTVTRRRVSNRRASIRAVPAFDKGGAGDTKVEAVCVPLLLSTHHISPTDIASLKKGITEVRLHSLACHGLEPEVADAASGPGNQAPEQAPQALHDESHHDNKQHIGHSASSKGTRPIRREPGAVQKRAPWKRPTDNWVDQWTSEQQVARPAIGSHNILPLLGYTVQSSVTQDGGGAGRVSARISLGLVTKFCTGGWLRDRLECEARLAERDVMRWMEQVLGALAHLHSLSIVHRAVGLDSVLLMPCGAMGDGTVTYNAKLANFSQAVALEDHNDTTTHGIERDALTSYLESLTEAVRAMTGHGLPPEVRSLVLPSPSDITQYYVGCPDEPVTFDYLSAMDVWAVGGIGVELMLKETLVSRDVFLSETPVERILTLLPARFGQPFKDVLTQALTRDPRRRPRAEAMLQLCLCVDPYLTAPPPPPAQPLHKRRPVLEEKEAEVVKPTTAAAAPRPTKGVKQRRKAKRWRRKTQQQVTGAPAETEAGRERRRVEAEMRAKALERANVRKEKAWFESLSERDQREVMWRREAYRKAKLHTQARRRVIKLASFRFWDAKDLSSWLNAVVAKQERKGGSIRDPTHDMDALKAQEAQKSEETKPIGRRASEGVNAATRRRSVMAPGGAAQKSEAAPPPHDISFNRMPYSERLRVMVLKLGVTGKIFDKVLLEARIRARDIVDDIAREAEAERRERERKGLMARQDYYDKVNFAKNFVPCTATEIGKLAPLEPIFRKIVYGPEPVVLPDEGVEHLRARQAAHRARIEADNRAIAEVIVNAYELMLVGRKRGQAEAAYLIIALFRGIAVRAKLRRIWAEAEEKSRVDMVQHEEQRLEQLRKLFMSTVYLKLEPFAVRSCSACIRLTSPVWAFLDEVSRSLNINFAVHIEDHNIVVDVVTVDKAQRSPTDHTKVLELGPLKPMTQYHVQVRLSEGAAAALKTSVEGDDNMLQLSYVINALQHEDNTVTFVTAPPLETPPSPTDVGVSLLPFTNLVMSAGLEATQSKSEHWEASRALGIPVDRAGVEQDPLMNHWTTQHPRVVAIRWSMPAAVTGDDTQKAGAAMCSVDSLQYLVQRTFQWSGAPHVSQWAQVYKGPTSHCYDLLKQTDLGDFLSEVRRRGRAETRYPPLNKVGVVYRVCAGNEFGWSDFSDVARLSWPMSDGSERLSDAESLDLVGVRKERFPPAMFGLRERDLAAPEYQQRLVPLPCITTKYRPPLAKQMAALSAGVWHSYLPVDPATLSRRKERLVRYREKLAEQGKSIV